MAKRILQVPAVKLLSENTPSAKAHYTARWARIMVKWLITRVRAKGRGWEIVNFTGPAGRESTGIVDLLAICKHHTAFGFPRGDLFEMILIQVKGGGARWPAESDIARLRAVQARYHARDVVLAEHKTGRQSVVYRLQPPTPGATARDAWGGAGRSCAAFQVTWARRELNRTAS